MFDPIAHYSITPQARIRRRRGRERRAWCKDEILEAHRHGISIHRIAQIFRERKVDISTQHLMRAIRLFIAEDQRGGGKASAAKEGRQGPAIAGEEKKRSVTDEPSEPVSPVVREEEFAKQLRLARYLAGTGVPAGRAVEPAPRARSPKEAKPVTKARLKTKKEMPGQKADEKELAKERRRAGRAATQKAPSSGAHQSEKQRRSPNR